ncbi:DoxX family protein [Halocatena halophila]|uniref:DoxX family protein n=1 Tax=Halocatena halophila TaxID=2814576 RepID=UPI002ED40320
MTLTVSTAYTVSSSLTIVAVGISAVGFFRPPTPILESMAEIDVAESWLPILGTVKAAGAFGLLIGMVTPVGQMATAAAFGLVVYFVGASIVHIRAGDYAVSGQHVYLLLAVGTLVLDLLS